MIRITAMLLSLLVAQVKVLSKSEISVMLKSGIEIRQSIAN